MTTGRFARVRIGSIVIRCYEFDRMLAFWQAALVGKRSWLHLDLYTTRIAPRMAQFWRDLHDVARFWRDFKLRAL